uniref:Uncharacterized protein n=1 Tax=Amphimedon queenslandica TaxID=400682 RepID=A0A1X7UN24_AMPQE
PFLVVVLLCESIIVTCCDVLAWDLAASKGVRAWGFG